jgi:HSP20 family molecular chaperone IbpA
MTTQDVVEFEAEKEEALEPEGIERTRPGRVYVPRVDIYETAEEVIILADVPGVDAESLDITLEKNVLTINGHVTPELIEGHELAHAEYGVGDYHRAFTISEDVNRDKIEASVNNGVLRLALPKILEPKTRKISVSTN